MRQRTDLKRDHGDWNDAYRKGIPIGMIARLAGVTRQAVQWWLVNNGFGLRKRILKPYVIFRGEKFSADKKGYMMSTTTIGRSLHRFKWESMRGPIPKGFHVHHKDENKMNNSIYNLECLSPKDHGELHAKLRKKPV